MRMVWRVLPVVLLGVAALSSGCALFQGPPPDEAVPAYRDARLAMMKGDYRGARDILQRFLESQPESKYRSDAQVLLGEAYLKMGDYGTAQHYYQDAQDHPRTKGVDARAKAGLGDTMMAQHRFSEAITAYEAALKKGSKELRGDEVLFYLGRAYMRNGDWGTGSKELHELLAQYPNSPLVAQTEDILKLQPNTFSVQVGAYASIDSANAMIARLRRFNATGHVFRRNHFSAPYAVRVGGYSNYNSAAAEASRLKGLGVPNFVVP